MADLTPAERFRVRLSVGALAAYLGLVALLTLVITPVNGQLATELAALFARLRAQGLPFFVTFTNVEAMANVALFVPLGALMTLCLHLWRWWVAPVVALLLSIGIEAAQFFFLPERVATWSDVVANTLGALIGAVGALVLRLLVRKRDRLLGRGTESA